MKRLFSAKSLFAAAVALGAVGAASVAHAGTSVTLSIGMNAPYGYVRPAPVYVQPQPVYVQPRPIYAQPRQIYVQPQPIYVQPRPIYVQPRPGYVQPQTIYYGHDRRWDRRGDRRGPYGDWDRDGVPNRFDRAPFDPYRR
jgi:hypothetical protein